MLFILLLKIILTLFLFIWSAKYYLLLYLCCCYLHTYLAILFYTHFYYTIWCIKIYGYYNLFVDYQGKISLCLPKNMVCVFIYSDLLLYLSGNLKVFFSRSYTFLLKHS